MAKKGGSATTTRFEAALNKWEEKTSEVMPPIPLSALLQFFLLRSWMHKMLLKIGKKCLSFHLVEVEAAIILGCPLMWALILRRNKCHNAQEVLSLFRLFLA